MRERIIEVRKALKMTQKEFAESLGLGQSTWAMIETGNRDLNERHVKLICSIHNVSEDWLRNGIGEMFRAFPEEDELSVYIEELLDGTDDKVHKAIRAFLLAYGKMNSVSKKVMNELIDNWLEEMKKEQD